MELKTGYIYIEKKKICFWNPISWITDFIRRFSLVKFTQAGILIIEDEEFYIVEPTTEGIKKTILKEKVADKKYNKDYAFIKPLYYYNEDDVIMSINSIHSEKLGIAELICYFLWHNFHIWSSDIKYGEKNNWIGYELVWYVFSEQSLTFRGNWWFSKPSWIFDSLEFDYIVIPPHHKDIK